MKRIQVSLTDEQTQWLDTWGGLNRSAAIRLLVAHAMEKDTGRPNADSDESRAAYATSGRDMPDSLQKSNVRGDLYEQRDGPKGEQSVTGPNQSGANHRDIPPSQSVPRRDGRDSS